jgi:ribosomal protein S18 acetylase RimI-like enzyme
MAEQGPVVVRRVRSDEYEAVGEVVVEAYRTLGDVTRGSYEQQMRDVAGRVASGEVLVAEVGGEVVGTVTVAVGPSALSEGDDPDAATIRMLAVAAQARGGGVGETLVRACIDRARVSGCRRVRLSTRTSMRSAQRLYERLGFRRDPGCDGRLCRRSGFWATCWN